MRIASLIPSGTDIAAALNLQAALVGVSHECDHVSAKGLPVLTRANVPDHHSASAEEIDRLVSSAVHNGDSLYLTDQALLVRLAPTVVLSQDVCDVCAVNAAQARCDVPGGADLVMLTATSLSGLWSDLERVGAATGTTVAARRLVADLQARVEDVQERVAGWAKPKVLTLEWSEPPFLGGHWVPEIVALAGGQHVLSGAGEPSRRATWSEIASADPDLIVFMPCGYNLGDATQELERLLSAQPEFSKLRAVRDGKLWVTNATALFSRCTPATVRALEVLSGVFHGAYEVTDQEAVRYDALSPRR